MERYTDTGSFRILGGAYKLDQDDKLVISEHVGSIEKLWRAYFSDPDFDKRGVYGEDIDVIARTPAEARRIATRYAEEELIPGCRVKRLRRLA